MLILKKLLQHVSVPLDHHQGARRYYPKVTTDHLLVRYTAVLQQHAYKTSYLHQCIVLKSFTF